MTRFLILLLAGVLPFVSVDAFAAKSVPTFRIQIPKKDQPQPPAQTEEDESSEVPSEQNNDTPIGTPLNAPKIPLGENDTPFTVEDNETEEAEETEEKPSEKPEIADETDEDRTPAKVFYGDQKLPEAVKKTRDKLLEIAKSGDISKLKDVFAGFSEPPVLSFDEFDDAIEFLKSSSGDGEGREILAILLEILESGYVHRDADDVDTEVYIWPYFTEIPPENLNPQQLVELFRIITAGDYQDMQAYGTYIFYRVGIAPNGDLKFFVAGD